MPSRNQREAGRSQPRLGLPHPRPHLIACASSTQGPATPSRPGFRRRGDIRSTTTKYEPGNDVSCRRFRSYAGTWRLRGAERISQPARCTGITRCSLHSDLTDGRRERKQLGRRRRGTCAAGRPPRAAPAVVARLSPRDADRLNKTRAERASSLFMGCRGVRSPGRQIGTVPATHAGCSSPVNHRRLHKLRTSVVSPFRKVRSPDEQPQPS